MSSDSSSEKSTISTQPLTKEKPKKKSHYRDLFNLYFFTVFQRRLKYLYLPYVKKNIYILSTVPPYELLADNHDMAFGYVDLNKADPVFRDLVRNWILGAFDSQDVCIRIDYFSTATVKCFGPKIIPGEELQPVKKELPKGEYPSLAVGYDSKNECTYYTYPSIFGEIPADDFDNIDDDEEESSDDDSDKRKTKAKAVAWDTSNGYAVIPVKKIYRDFKRYLEDDKVIHLKTEEGFPRENESIRVDDKLFKFKPALGFDVMITDKVETEVDELLLSWESNTVLQYLHHIKGDGVEVVLTRPNCVLFPWLTVEKEK